MKESHGTIASPVPDRHAGGLRLEVKWSIESLSGGGVCRIGRVLAFVVLTACATQQQVRAVKPHDDAGAYVDVGGIRTYYVHRGIGDEPVLLIHGIAASTFSYRHNIAPLAEQFSVYALDLKGFGASDKPLSWTGYGLDDLRDQVLGFMDAVGVEHAAVVGTSMGGEVAIRLALAAPDRVDALVLIDSAGFLRWQDTPLESRVLSSTPFIGEFLTAPLPLIQQATRLTVARYLRKVFYDPSLVTPTVVDGYYLPLATPGGTNGLLALMRSRDWGGVADRIGEIQAPTLVLWGQEDHFIPVAHADLFRRALPGATVITYPECGHNPQAERPELVNRDLIAFLSTHT